MTLIEGLYYFGTGFAIGFAGGFLIAGIRQQKVLQPVPARRMIVPPPASQPKGTKLPV